MGCSKLPLLHKLQAMYSCDSVRPMAGAGGENRDDHRDKLTEEATHGMCQDLYIALPITNSLRDTFYSILNKLNTSKRTQCQVPKNIRQTSLLSYNELAAR